MCPLGLGHEVVGWSIRLRAAAPESAHHGHDEEGMALAQADPDSGPSRAAPREVVVDEEVRPSGGAVEDVPAGIGLQVTTMRALAD